MDQRSGASGLEDPLAVDPLEEIRANWSDGPHADSYVLDADGKNRECARCHSRTSWFPGIEEQPLGWSNFELNYRPSLERIPEANWDHVQCAVCHRLENEAGNFDVAWLEVPPQGIYVEPEVPDLLCQQCHDGSGRHGHLAVRVEGVHEGLLCVDCHDPHDGRASCTSSGCHATFQSECKPIQAHSKPHLKTTCEACHAAGEHEIKLDESRGLWQLFRQVEISGEVRWVPFVPHDIRLQVDCERCHTPGELPWMD